MSVLLAALIAVLFACGAWLLMQRRLSRIIIGIGLLGHGGNLLLVASGGAGGRVPIIGSDERVAEFADPMPQALALTAIVITFGVSAFLLALAFRSWQLTRDDRVEADVEDRLLARLEAEHAEDAVVRPASAAVGDADGADPGAAAADGTSGDSSGERSP